MLTFEQIKELIDQVASHRLSGLELERSGFRLKIDGQRISPPDAGGSVHLAVPGVGADSAPTMSHVPAGAAAQVEKTEVEAAEPETLDGHILSSPIVGTFYRSPNPESAPFVEVGDRVKTGQVLCIVEAMKLMNEIEADADGVIVDIYPKNAQPVEFGEKLFAIKAD